MEFMDEYRGIKKGILITLTGLVSLTIATGIQDYHRAKRMQPIVNQLYTILAEDDNIISRDEKSKFLKDLGVYASRGYGTKRLIGEISLEKAKEYIAKHEKD